MKHMKALCVHFDMNADYNLLLHGINKLGKKEIITADQAPVWGDGIYD